MQFVDGGETPGMCFTRTVQKHYRIPTMISLHIIQYQSVRSLFSLCLLVHSFTGPSAFSLKCPECHQLSIIPFWSFLNIQRKCYLESLQKSVNFRFSIHTQLQKLLFCHGVHGQGLNPFFLQEYTTIFSSLLCVSIWHIFSVLSDLSFWPDRTSVNYVNGYLFQMSHWWGGYSSTADL